MPSQPAKSEPAAATTTAAATTAATSSSSASASVAASATESSSSSQAPSTPSSADRPASSRPRLHLRRLFSHLLTIILNLGGSSPRASSPRTEEVAIADVASPLESLDVVTRLGRGAIRDSSDAVLPDGQDAKAMAESTAMNELPLPIIATEGGERTDDFLSPVAKPLSGKLLGL